MWSRIGPVLGASTWYGISAAIAKALALITVPYLARTLTPEGYGLADLATSTAAILSLVVMCSADIPAARAFGTASDTGMRLKALSSYVWGTVLVAVLAMVALIPFAGIIAEQLWAAPDESGLAILTLVLVPIGAVQATLTQTRRIEQQPRSFAVLSFVDLFAQLGLALAFVAMGLGPTGVVVGFVLGSTIGLLVAGIAGRSVLRIAPDWSIARRFMLAGAAFLPYATFFILADWLLRTFVANSFGATSVAELGLAIRVASVLSLVTAAFSLAWGPIGLARNPDTAAAAHFGRVLLAFGAASLAMALMLGAIGPELIPVIAGEGYDAAATILPGFAIAYAIAGMEYVLVVTAGVSDRGTRVTIASTIGAACQVTAAFIVVPLVGVGAIGPIVVFGRTVSFLVLLTGVRRSIVIPQARLALIGVMAGTAYVFVVLTANSEAFWLFRWLVGLALGLFAVVFTTRLVSGNAENESSA